MPDNDLESWILFICITVALSAVGRLLAKTKKDTKYVPKKKGNIRRLGLLERNHNKEYERSGSVRTTAFNITLPWKLNDEEILNALDILITKNPVLTMCIFVNSNNEENLIFMPMSENTFVEAAKTEATEVSAILEESLAAGLESGQGPLWAMSYSGEQEVSASDETFKYIFTIKYHPSLLDPWSLEILIKFFVEALLKTKEEEEDVLIKNEPEVTVQGSLHPSLDALVGIGKIRESFAVLGFLVKYLYYTVIPLSWLKDKANDMIKNDYVLKYEKKARFKSSQMSEKTCIRKLELPKGDVLTLDQEDSPKGCSLQSVIMTAASFAMSSLMGDDVEKNKLKCAFVQDARKWTKSLFTQVGNYQYSNRVELVVPKVDTSSLEVDKKVFEKALKQCHKQEIYGKSKAGCQRYIRDEHFLSRFVSKRLNLNKLTGKYLGRSSSMIMLEHSEAKVDTASMDIVGDGSQISIEKLGSTMGLVQNGPVFYISSCLFSDKLLVSVSYSNALITESDADAFCNVFSKCMAKSLRE